MEKKCTIKNFELFHENSRKYDLNHSQMKNLNSEVTDETQIVRKKLS